MSKPKRIRRKIEMQPGDVIGSWTILSPSQKRKSAIYWRCRCQCGTEKDVSQSTLSTGKSKRCSKCIRRTHGLSSTELYVTYKNMLRRCYCKDDISYKNYGARGIGVCDRWRESVNNFIIDMSPKPSGRHSLDRIDNSRDYSPDNCRWVTRDVQNKNKRDNNIINFNGESKTITEWAKALGMTRCTLLLRIRKNLPLDTPRREGQRLEKRTRGILSADDVLRIRQLAKTISYKEIAKIYGMSEAGVSNIVRKKRWPHISENKSMETGK